MQKFKKVLYCIISLLLVVCMLSLFFYSSEESSKPVQTFSADEIEKNATLIGYTTETDEDTGNTEYHSILNISHIVLPYNGNDFNTVIVKLSEPMIGDIKEDPLEGLDVEWKYPKDEDAEDEGSEDDESKFEPIQPPLMYYNIDESGYFVSGDFCEASVSEDETTLIFRTYYTEEKNAIALKFDGNFSIDSVSVYMVESTHCALNFNPIAFFALLAILLLLVLIEKKFGYFSWIVEHVRNEVEYIKELRSGKRLSMWLHVCALLFTAAFIVTVAVLIILNKFWFTTIIIAFALALAAVIFQLIDRIHSGRNATAAKIFLVITVIIGIMMCYTSPPSTHTAWDDEIHFRFAYLFANGTDGSQSLAEYKLFTHSYTINDYVNDPSYFAKIMIAESEIPLDYELDSVQPYTLISYSPMILMMMLLRLLQVDILKTLVLCRLANLLAWSVITYFGIKKLKGGTLIFSAICLLPGVLYLGCSFSYDMWLTAWLTYAFAYIISEFQQPEKKLTATDMIKILLAFFVGCSAKAIYCVMMLPMLFFGKNKFTDKAHARRFRFFTVLMILVIVAMLIIPGLFTPDMYSDSRGGDDVSSSGQLMFILSKPLYFVKVMLKHLSEYCSLSRFNTYSTAFGYLGGYDGNMYPVFGTIAAIILIFCVFTDNTDKDNYELMGKQRVITILTIFAQIALISAAMYLAFNDVGSSVINGCQFRYLFPLFPAFFYFMRSKRMRYTGSDKFRSAFVFGGLTLTLMLGCFVTYIYRFLF